MTSVTNTNNSYDYHDSLKWQDQTGQPPPANNNNKLSQEDFFALMTQQLAFQDPTKPMDNDQMISQMASFSTIEAMADMTGQMAMLSASVQSSQALQASTLVGKSVLIPTETGYLPEGGEMSGTIVAGNNSGPITVRIEDENGQLIKTMTLDESEGNVPFTWDGTDDNGDPVGEGKYVVKATSRVDGETQELKSAIHASVESVTVNTGQFGAILNLQGLGSVLLSDVLEVGAGPVGDGGIPSEPVEPSDPVATPQLADIAAQQIQIQQLLKRV